jgi:hypothetical protein
MNITLFMAIVYALYGRGQDHVGIAEAEYTGRAQHRKARSERRFT